VFVNIDVSAFLADASIFLHGDQGLVQQEMQGDERMEKENDWQTANAQKYIWGYRGDRIILRGRDIVYAHIEQRKVYIHTRTAVYRVGGTLSETEELLKELPMIRTHAAYLVHMDYLQKINRNMAILKNGEKIPVSTRCWKVVKPTVEAYAKKKQ
jgi:DNA-binding LytR/AlgR family response regulator